MKRPRRRSLPQHFHRLECIIGGYRAELGEWRSKDILSFEQGGSFLMEYDPMKHDKRTILTKYCNN